MPPLDCEHLKVGKQRPPTSPTANPTAWWLPYRAYCTLVLSCANTNIFKYLYEPLCLPQRWELNLEKALARGKLSHLHLDALSYCWLYKHKEVPPLSLSGFPLKVKAVIIPVSEVCGACQSTEIVIVESGYNADIVWTYHPMFLWREQFDYGTITHKKVNREACIGK